MLLPPLLPSALTAREENGGKGGLMSSRRSFIADFAAPHPNGNLRADTAKWHIHPRILNWIPQAAYSKPRLPLIPDEACHPFHAKAATDSTAKLPPRQAA